MKLIIVINLSTIIIVKLIPTNLLKSTMKLNTRKGFHIGHTLRYRPGVHAQVYSNGRPEVKVDNDRSLYPSRHNRFLCVQTSVSVHVQSAQLEHRLLVDDGPGSGCPTNLKKENRHRAKITTRSSGQPRSRHTNFTKM